MYACIETSFKLNSDYLMRTPTISVIVAVYQAEAYLHRCVDSILSQTFVDFELLLIDDGSTDRSGVICDEYAKKDSRIKVIHKQNEGLSATRQVGIDHAIGEYTIHCDPDDWMEADMLEALVTQAKEKRADIVICDFIYENGTNTSVSRQKLGSENASLLMEDLYSPLCPSLCNKLIRLDCYKQYQVKFAPNLVFGEDLFVMIQLCQHPLCVACVKQSLYHYDKYSNINSLTKNIDLQGYIQSTDFFANYFGESAKTPILKLKSATLWYAFRNQAASFHEYDNLYPEVNRYLFTSGLKHPILFWHHLVLALYRYHHETMGRLLLKLVKIGVSVRNYFKTILK